jgi:hypothetical protein
MMRLLEGVGKTGGLGTAMQGARSVMGSLMLAGALLLASGHCSGALLSPTDNAALNEDALTSGVRPAVAGAPPEIGPTVTPRTPPPRPPSAGAATRTGESLNLGLPGEASQDRTPFDARSLIVWFAWGAGGLIVLFLIVWGRGIAVAVARKREYQAAQIDPHPSVEERFLSELATMQVALLRSSAQGFYEKADAMLCQILKSRRLTDAPLASSEEILAHLRSMGVDAAFLDCVESILQRCDAVRLQGARPDTEAHARLIRDLGTLIRMRPTAGVRRAERKGLGRRPGAAAIPPDDETQGQ